MKKLTISVDDTVYEGLHAQLGKGKIGKFLEDLARPYVVKDALERVYAQMTADKEREAEAAEWTGALAGDIDDAAW